MGDFISNDPNGKSDLHKFAPSATESPAEANTEAEALSTTSETAQITVEASSKTTENTQASPIQATQGGIFPGQGMPSYQNQQTSPYPHLQQNPYGYHGPMGQAPAEKSPKDGYNMASMILGIVAWAGLVLCCGCISPIPAIASIITAFLGRENGKFNGKAIAGIILSVSFLVIYPILFIVFLYVAEVEPSNSSGDLVEMMITFISGKYF